MGVIQYFFKKYVNIYDHVTSIICFFVKPSNKTPLFTLIFRYL